MAKATVHNLLLQIYGGPKVDSVFPLLKSAPVFFCFDRKNFAKMMLRPILQPHRKRPWQFSYFCEIHTRESENRHLEGVFAEKCWFLTWVQDESLTSCPHAVSVSLLCFQWRHRDSLVCITFPLGSH